MSFLKIVTNKPVAIDSPDYVEPWGTARDNSKNYLFNKKLFWWLSPKIKVLDLGCSGGGFVKSVIDQGGFAIGIEGSDYSKKIRRAEWANIPDNLFTADISEPFELSEIKDNGEECLLKFNVVTAWEVMEHISSAKLENVFKNISKHLMPDGVVIFSISTKDDFINGINLHQIVKSESWWIGKLNEFGFYPHKDALIYFGDDWVRGGQREPESFQVVLSRNNEKLPHNERLKFLLFIAKPLNKITIGIRKTMKFIRRIIPNPIKRIYKSLRS